MNIVLSEAAELDRLIARVGAAADPETMVRKLPALRSVYRDYFRRLIFADPRRAAIELDDERLSRLDELGAREPSLPLEGIGETYVNKRPPLSASWQRKARLFWPEFRRIVNVDTVRDITADDIGRYQNEILDRGNSPTYVGHRFGLVKSVLSYALKRGKDTEQLQRVLTLCKMLETPKKNGTDPHPISREHFDALLAVSDAKWRAVFLLSLNAALYPSEVAAVLKPEIDLDNGTFVTDRNKTGVTRIAVLWQRTVDAIRGYQAERPHDSPYLFVSQTGAQYNSNHVGRNFRRRRETAGLPESVEFAHIRDGAYTAAIEAGADLTHAKLLAGHSVGISDSYLRRNPTMVADCCMAIERQFFGEQEIERKD
jgi:integrase